LVPKNWISDSISERIWRRWSWILKEPLKAIEEIFPQLKIAEEYKDKKFK
jgi:hypothetical protein